MSESQLTPVEQDILQALTPFNQEVLLRQAVVELAKCQSQLLYLQRGAGTDELCVHHALRHGRAGMAALVSLERLMVGCPPPMRGEGRREKAE